MKKQLIIWICTLAFGLTMHLQAQDIPVIEDFATLEARMNQPTDTLVVYNFWATWCRPCVAELPYFEKLNQEYAEKKVKVVLVSLDIESMGANLPVFVQRLGLQSEVVHLTDGKQNDWIPKINESWGGAIPATLIKMPEKDIHAFKAQSFTYEELKIWVDELLK